MQFQVSGMAELQAVLAKAQGKLENRLPLMDDLGHIVTLDIEKNITSEGKRLGVTWKALAPKTQELRKKHGFPPAHPILIETGDMVGRIRMTKRTNDEVWVEPTGRGGIPEQENIVKARKHQLGVKPRIPQRRFFEISPTGLKELKQKVTDYVKRAFQ